MTYQRFEDLPVWKAAIQFALDVFALVNDRAFAGAGDLRSQLQRASLSVSNNIAEGFERGTTPELLTFLYIARGSAGETRSALRFSSTLPATRHLRPRIDDLIPAAESVSRQLRAWADSLQNADIPGQRYLTDQTARDYRAAKGAEQFMETLRKIQNQGKSRVEPAPSDDA